MHGPQVAAQRRGAPAAARVRLPAQRALHRVLINLGKIRPNGAGFTLHDEITDASERIRGEVTTEERRRFEADAKVSRKRKRRSAPSRAGFQC